MHLTGKWANVAERTLFIDGLKAMKLCNMWSYILRNRVLVGRDINAINLLRLKLNKGLYGDGHT